MSSRLDKVAFPACCVALKYCGPASQIIRVAAGADGIATTI